MMLNNFHYKFLSSSTEPLPYLNLYLRFISSDVKLYIVKYCDADILFEGNTERYFKGTDVELMGYYICTIDCTSSDELFIYVTNREGFYTVTLSMDEESY